MPKQQWKSCMRFSNAKDLTSRIESSAPVQAQPAVAYVGDHAHNLVAKVPYLNWFVQPFDEAVQRSWWGKR